MRTGAAGLAGMWLQLFLASFAQAQTHHVDVYLFWQQGCSHCERQIRDLAAIEAADPAVRVHHFELAAAANLRFYSRAAQSIGMREIAVPLTVIGNTAVIGATTGLDAEVTAEILIADCRRTACADVLAPVARELAAVADRALAMREIGASPVAADREVGLVKLPLVGHVNLRSLSLPALTVVLAAVDGFNPCAMWVLIFLIGLLLGVQDHARRWILGSAFLLTTAIVYYVVIAAWLGTLLVVGMVGWLRAAIGVLALAGGAYYLWEYLRHPDAICRVAGETRRREIMGRLRAAAGEPRFLVALAAIVVLAVGVNFIELMCSAGIPAVYTQVLALTPMPTWQYYAWIGLYVAIFLLDDFIVFAVAMATLKVGGASVRYAHHVQLLGGVVLLAIGLILIFRPEWLRFG